MTKQVIVSPYRMSKVALAFILASCVLMLSACTSSGPATSYYSLAIDKTKLEVKTEAPARPSIGIGPVVLPGYLERSGIVSRKHAQRLNVSGTHVWAEELDGAIARELSSALAYQLPNRHVEAFPWDARARPEQQIRLFIERFDGSRKGEVELMVLWTRFDMQKNIKIDSGREQFIVQTSKENYSDYSRTLSELLRNFSQKLSSTLLEK